MEEFLEQAWSVPVPAPPSSREGTSRSGANSGGFWNMKLLRLSRLSSRVVHQVLVLIQAAKCLDSLDWQGFIFLDLLCVQECITLHGPNFSQDVSRHFCRTEDFKCYWHLALTAKGAFMDWACPQLVTFFSVVWLKCSVQCNGFCLYMLYHIRRQPSSPCAFFRIPSFFGLNTDHVSWRMSHQIIREDVHDNAKNHKSVLLAYCIMADASWSSEMVVSCFDASGLIGSSYLLLAIVTFFLNIVVLWWSLIIWTADVAC